MHWAAVSVLFLAVLHQTASSFSCLPLPWRSWAVSPLLRNVEICHITVGSWCFLGWWGGFAGGAQQVKTGVVQKFRWERQPIESDMSVNIQYLKPHIQSRDWVFSLIDLPAPEAELENPNRTHSCLVHMLNEGLSWMRRFLVCGWCFCWIN